MELDVIHVLLDEGSIEPGAVQLVIMTWLQAVRKLQVIMGDEF